MQTGLDRLLAEPALRAPLAGRRVALLAHPASVTADLTHALDALAACGDLRLAAAFGPQHGLRGDKQDNMIESPHATDSRRRVPVYSLYSETREPTSVMLRDLDVLVIDLQDVGARIYTFIYTMANCLRAAGRHGIPVNLNTDDEGVSRSNLTMEWVKAVRTYAFGYRDLKDMARNSLEYSFLTGPGLYLDRDYRRLRPGFEGCRRPEWKPSAAAQRILGGSEKMQVQLRLERAFAEFER